MNYNANKYYLAESKQLSEPEKLQIAKALRELELRGVLQYREGHWGLAPGLEVEETPDRRVARFPKQNDAVPDSFVESSTPSSGEPSETRVPPLAQAARPSSEGPGSPDSDDEDNKQ